MFVVQFEVFIIIYDPLVCSNSYIKITHRLFPGLLLGSLYTIYIIWNRLTLEVTIYDYWSGMYVLLGTQE